MKTTKILSLCLAVLMVFALCACGSKDVDDDETETTAIFGNTKLDDYVTLGKYKGIEVSTDSDDYKGAQNLVIYEDIESKSIDEQSCYIEPVYRGKVKKGDNANIDYMGKKDGVAFDGGTAQGHDLKIGSGQFIDGFEDGLIGVNIGDTVDLDLKFPESYGNAELAGAAVVFTVKVNYVRTPDINKIYSLAGFKSAEEYKEDLKERTIKSFLVDKVMSDSTVKGVSKSDEDTLFKAYCDYTETRLKEQGSTLNDALASYGMTLEDYRSQISSALEKELEESMIYYSILKKQGLEIKYQLSASEKTGQYVLDEISKVKNIVKDFIYENAKIK